MSNTHALQTGMLVMTKVELYSQELCSHIKKHTCGIVLPDGGHLLGVYMIMTHMGTVHISDFYLELIDTPDNLDD